MGSVLTPIMEGMEAAADLPDACCSDGRCEEICPMMIPLPDLLRKLRERERDMGLAKRSFSLGLSAYMTLARFPRLYQMMARVWVGALSLAQRRGKAPLPLARKCGWTQVREIPVPQGQTFQSLLARQRKQDKGAPNGS
jgi:L-lactate dehydrogenase complex protein LldF